MEISDRHRFDWLTGALGMEQHVTVLFRDARYFDRHVKKFNLFLLTVLSPVGK